MHHAKASVTPLRTSFAEPDEESYGNLFVTDSPAAAVTDGNENGAGTVTTKMENLVGRPWKL